MFKKFLIVFVVALSVLFMGACGKRTYAADGVYTAFSNEIHKDGPQVTMVSVTIENDKVKSFFIDCLQSTKKVDEKTQTVSWAFDAKTKKELKYAYGMHKFDYIGTLPEDAEYTEEGYKAWLEANNVKEWFQQAELLEAFFVKEGTDKITVDTESKAINNVTGVTIKDGGYSKLAAEAVKLAKAGKAQVVVGDGNSLAWVTAAVNKKGEFTSLKIDTLQGQVDAEGKFTWNEKSKQELGYAYGMHRGKYEDTLAEGVEGTEEGYKAWLKANNKFEWFEQVDKLAAYVLANGVDEKIVVGDDKKLSNAPEVLTGVTVKVATYKTLFETLYNNFK